MKTKSVEILELPVRTVVGSETSDFTDSLSVEEPLEIRLFHGNEPPRSIAVTMRTPGQDEELAIGFLYTEGIISGFDQVYSTRRIGCNIVEVELVGKVEIEPTQLDRHSFIASSCGVCGKKSIEAVQARRKYSPVNPFPLVEPDVVHQLPDKLRLHQKSFGSTGGIHASGLFDFTGDLIMVREDVGRHNALDKLIGACAQQSLLPLEKRIILVSGRASFELVQKAAHAGVTALAAVGAPSSLAVELAQNSGLTLMGFVRGNRFNIYTAPVTIFLLCAFLTSYLWFAAPAHSKALGENRNTAPAIVLAQSHRPIGGLEVAITKTALKISFRDFGTYMLASAPDWHIAYCNPVSRMVRNFTYVNFSTYGTSLSACAEYPEFEKGKSTSMLVAGVNADCYKTKDKSDETTEVCVDRRNDIDPKIIAIVAKLYRLPNLGGLPLDAHTDSPRHEKAGVTPWLPGKELDGKSHRNYRLQTLSIKQEKRSANDFKYPLGFKETKDESAISFAHRADGLIDFLTGDGIAKPTQKTLAKPVKEPQ